MDKMIHLAAQYLATASKSFLEPVADDSHTNLGFSLDDGAIYSRVLDGKKGYLCLSYKTFSLEWFTPDGPQILSLDGRTHGEIVQWLQKMTSTAIENGRYTYDLHYDLPYEPITDGFTFELKSTRQLEELIHYRILIQLVLENFLKEEKLQSEIRIWPHHFDTGAFTAIEDLPGIAIGLGLAEPDSLCNNPYFYISAYRGHEGVTVDGYPELAIGSWGHNGFAGAILDAKDRTREDGISFFREALATYRLEIKKQ